MCSACFPRLSLLADASLSSTGSSGASSPASTVLSKRYDALQPSRRTSFPSFGGTSVALVAFAPWRTSAPPRPGVGNPVSPAGKFAEERTGFSQVPGEPRLSVCTCSNPTPAGLLAPDHCSAAAWPLNAQVQRLPRSVFRRSIAWLSDSLRAPCAAWSASQCGLLQHHARLASSCWSGSTGRGSHPQGSDERFQSCNLHLIPLSQTSWRKRCDRGALSNTQVTDFELTQFDCEHRVC